MMQDRAPLVNFIGNGYNNMGTNLIDGIYYLQLVAIMQGITL